MVLALCVLAAVAQGLDLTCGPLLCVMPPSLILFTVTL